MSDRDEIIDRNDHMCRVESLDVVAVDGEGMFVVDDAGRTWRFASHDPLQAGRDELAKHYQEATDGQ